MSADSRRAQSNQAIYFAALSICDERERGVFLDDACAEDVERRRSIERLLAIGDPGPDSPLERVIGQLNPEQKTRQPAETRWNDLAPSAPLDISSHPMIDRYKLLEQIGEGGMGVVYMAEQTHPVRRKVALKLIKPGMDSHDVIARFEAERQALAMMDHANIARVLEAGTTPQGRPYFVMDLVRGIPITEFCEQHRLPNDERLQLFTDVCHAIQHAHQKGIIHRDLKPSNILITMDGERAIAKVIDFGIAKALSQQQLTEKTLFTAYGQMVGTPMYMSPEQAQLSVHDVDTRSDVYSLGVLLYELLTGTTPFDKETLQRSGFDEMRRLIREVDPPRPSHRISTLNSEQLSTAADHRHIDPRSLAVSLRGELDWIVMKSLEKDLNRRYESASALAADIQRHLGGAAVQACPPSFRYRLGKMVQRHRHALTAAVIIMTAVTGGALGSIRYAVQAGRASNDARLARNEAERQADAAQIAAIAANQAKEREKLQRQRAESALYISDVRLADALIEESQHYAALVRLAAHLPAAEESDLRGWEWYYLAGKGQQAKRTWKAHGRAAPSVAWSPDGGLIATVSHDGSARIWNAVTGELMKEMSDGRTIKIAVAWDPAGRRLAWGSAGTEGALRIWDRQSDTVSLLQGNGQSIWDIAWSHDGKRIATSGIRVEDKDDVATVHLWDPEGGPPRDVARLYPNVTKVAWSHDDRVIAASIQNGNVHLFDADSLKKLERIEERSTSCDWSPAADVLSIGTMMGDCVLIDPDGEQLHRWKAHFDAVLDVRWSPDGQHIATASSDGTVKVWNLDGWSLQFVFSGHDGTVGGIAWSPDSRMLVSVGSGGVANILSPFEDDFTEKHLPAVKPSESCDPAFYWTQRDVLRTIQSSSVVDWRATNESIVAEHRLPANGEWWTLHPRCVILKNSNPKEAGELTLLTGHPERPIRYLTGGVYAPHDYHGVSLDGTRVAYVNAYKSAPRVLDLNGGAGLIAPVILVGVRDVGWSPDGSRVAFGGSGLSTDDGTSMFYSWVHIIDSRSAAHLRRVRIGNRRESATAVAWSPDSAALVGGNEGGLCEVFDSATGERRSSTRFHASAVMSLDWHPTEPRIASAGRDGAVKVWDSRTADMLLSLEVGLPITCVAWSPDGRMLAAKDESGSIHAWDSTRGRQHATLAK